MSQWWKKSNQRKTRTMAARRPKVSRTILTATPLDDRIVPATFSGMNTTPIDIPGPAGAGGAGPSTPSTITASGLTGVVTHLTVTFNDLSHDSVDDIDALLVAPDGTNIYLMSDNGGANNSVSHVSPVFDSSATDTIGSFGVGAGPYAPLNVNEGDADTIPGVPATPPVTTLGIGGFYGINPNGAWQLLINDDSALSTGQMAGGWSLSFDYRPNTPPVAINDTYAATENTTLNVTTPATGVLANDTDANGDTKTAHLVAGPANGSVTLNGDGTFAYVPNHYFSGADTFSYRDDDGVTYGNTATVTVNVAHVNQPPQGVADSYTLQNGGPQYVGPDFGVLANDVDPDGAVQNTTMYSQDFQSTTLQAFPAGITAGASNSTHTDWAPNLPPGWVRDNAPAGYPATPAPASPTDPGNVYYGWHVLDIDSWIAEQGAPDGQDRDKFENEVNYPGFSAPNVGSHNHVLVADGDAYDDYVSIGTTHMSTYAYLPPVPLTGGVDGTLKLDFDSSFRPEDPADGLQQGTVDVSLDGGVTWTNLLTQDNTDPNNPTGPPLHKGDESRINTHYSLPVNNPVGATALFRFGYLDAGNDWWWAVDNINVTESRTDPTTLTPTVTQSPSHGALNFNHDGSFTYTATTGYTGADSFSYSISDGQYTSGPVTVAIQVNANTTSPVAVNDAYTTTQDHALSVRGRAGLLINDSDPDTGGFLGLTTSQLTPPAHGSLTFNADGSFIYTPSTGYSGTDSFTYAESDAAHTSNAATVTITVLPLSPKANNDTYRATINTPLTTTAATGVLANDVDPNGLPITAVVVTAPAHGNLTLNADGSFTYTPTAGYFGADSFTYNASNGTYTSVTPGTVSITVVPQPPTANNDAYSVNVNGTLTTTAATGVKANDTDPNNLPFTTVLAQAPAHGTLTFNADGSFTYVPHQFYYGPDSFTYTAFDATYTVSSAPATVNITVNQLDVAPAANADAFATAANTPLVTTAANGLLANDRDDGVVTTLATENFDELPLTAFPTGIAHGATGNANGDWTDSVPATWTLDNAPAGHTPTPPPSDPTGPGEVYYGWHVLDIDSWAHEQGDQDRSKMLNERGFPGFSQTAPLVGSHNHVLVADGDAYFDYPHTGSGLMSTMFISPSVSLAGLNQNSLTLEFDSSFRPEGQSKAMVDVSYDGGTTWNNLLSYAGQGGNEAHINEHLTLDANNPAGATTAQFRFGYLDASNDWWWAVDNIKVTGATPNAGATLTAAAASQPHHGTVAVNSNGSFTYTPTAGYTGLDSFTYTASDGTHTSAPATATVLVGSSSVGVQVNDGSLQRSEVRNITIGFNGAAIFSGSPAAAFQLTQVVGGASVPVTATVTNAGGLTDVTLTFSGAATDPVSGQNGGVLSLADGQYQLTILSSAVSVNGQALDGDNDGTAGGNYVSPADTLGGGTGQLQLYRLFGDATGDGIVDQVDLAAFRGTFNNSLGSAAYLAFLDANNDTHVDQVDLAQFRTRFNTNVF